MKKRKGNVASGSNRRKAEHPKPVAPLFTRETVFTPAYDRRHPEPSKNYGIHGVDMRWYLKGPLGAVQFVVFTGWMPDHVEKEMERPGYPFRITRPMAADLGYHSPKPMYEGQTDMGKCNVIAGGKCYYDGSSLNAEKPFRILKEQGGDAVWDFLKKYYEETFIGRGA